MDKNREKIIDATMELILERGYTATTTKDIAERAGVNECTIFRKFGEKKEIVVEGMKLKRWHPDISEETFSDIKWDLSEDLKMFMRNYIKEVTPAFVKLSIGLRSPQIYDITAPLIMNIPSVFNKSLSAYLAEMKRKGKIGNIDCETFASNVLASTFGYVFFKASFGDALIESESERYIDETVRIWTEGVLK